MNNITYSKDNCKEEATSTWLIAVMQFGLKIDLFKFFEGFKIKMKEVKYSVYQKLITTIMSVVIGCETTKDINEKLGAEKLALNMFDMDTVPDQSQINEPIRRFDSDSINHFYNKRQTIEAFFKMAKNVYHIRNLRTSKFYGIYGFLWLVFITHNLISWFKSTVLYGTELENVGVRVLVKNIGNIKGFVKRTSEGIKVNIPPITKLARLIADALCSPKYIQITFNI